MAADTAASHGATERTDTVVVGSGFGASAAAYRLAESGQSVVVLERGKAYPPGSFARTPAEFSNAMWDPSEGGHGLYDMWGFDQLDALVASGLGGGSLIYANVLLRKDPAWFQYVNPYGPGRVRWPFSRADLDPHYDNAEAMLAPQELPLDQPEYQLPKTMTFKHAAESQGLDWRPVNLAVRFANDGQLAQPGEPLAEAPYGNIHGSVPRRTCRLCGECNIGCNDGAKNTLDHTYLSAAAQDGADIRTRSEVRQIRRLADGTFNVGYVVHDPANEGYPTATQQLPLRVINTQRVVMGAGALGSTYLLLRNRAGLPGLSAKVGAQMCGNGDLLGFLLHAKNSDKTARVVDGHRGPVITSTVRAQRGDQLAYVQDAGFPAFAAWMVESMQVGDVAVRGVKVVARRLAGLLRREWNPRLSGDFGRLLGDGTASSSSLPLLGMGIDIADGRFDLADNRLTCDWRIDRSNKHFSLVQETMETIATAANAKFKINPSWLFRRVVTVHPLGGCPSSVEPEHGVVDPWGQAHGVPGLWVVDGSALPGPVGPNPSLTIAAFADRAAERMIDA